MCISKKRVKKRKLLECNDKDVYKSVKFTLLVSFFLSLYKKIRERECVHETGKKVKNERLD